MQRASLTQRTLKGVFWTFSGTGVQAVLKVAVLAVLARLLVPADFGVIGAALIVISFLDIFSQLGLAPAIVQRPDLTDAHLKAGQTASIVLGCAMGVLVFLLAPAIAALFRIDALEPAIRFLSLVFPLKGLAVVSEAVLLRQMRFKQVALVTISSYLAGYAAVSIALAALGWGVNALVMGLLAQALFARLSYLFLVRLPWGFSLDRTALRQLFAYGSGQTLSSFGSFCALNADYIVVGRWLGVEALGIYSRAYQFLMQPTNLIGGALDRVLFSAMGEAQSDDQKIAHGYRQAVAITAMIAMPLSAMLAILAPEIIRILLGPQWTAVVVPFQILSLVLVCRIGYKASDAVARAMGRVYSTAARQWLYAVLVATGAFIGSYRGTDGVALGVSIALILQYLVMLHFGRSLTSVPLIDIAFIHLRHFTVAILVGIAVILAKLGLASWDLPALFLVVGGGAAGGIALLLLWFLVPRLFGEEGLWVAKQIRKYRRSRLARKQV